MRDGKKDEKDGPRENDNGRREMRERIEKERKEQRERT